MLRIDRSTTELLIENKPVEKNSSIDLKMPVNFLDTLSEKYLNYCIRALKPIVRNKNLIAINKLVAEKSIEKKKTSLMECLIKLYPTNTLEEFRKYMVMAYYVDQQFGSTGTAGFDTDRGDIYIRYGKPTSVYSRSEEHSKIPYEIWEYHQLEGIQNSAEFVFFNPSLSPNNYKLIHSTAQGEKSNSNWREEITRNQYGSRPPNSSTTSPNQPDKKSNIWEDGN
jgi:GWxTD domain-containing protein